MAVTRLERKLKRDRAKSKRRIATIKRLNAMPPTKNIDIEAIKAEFEKKKGGAAKKKEEAKPAPEAKVGAKAEAAPAEVKEAPKKKAPKKEEKVEAAEEAPKAEAPKAKEPAKKGKEG